MATVISCKATEEFQAEAIVYELKAAGFVDSAISVEVGERSISITVHAQDSHQTQQVEEIFHQTEAQDISVAEEAGARR